MIWVKVGICMSVKLTSFMILYNSIEIDIVEIPSKIRKCYSESSLNGLALNDREQGVILVNTLTKIGKYIRT